MIASVAVGVAVSVAVAGVGVTVGVLLGPAVGSDELNVATNDTGDGPSVTLCCWLPPSDHEWKNSPSCGEGT